MMKVLLDHTPLRREGRPEEIAAVVASCSPTRPASSPASTCWSTGAWWPPWPAPAPRTVATVTRRRRGRPSRRSCSPSRSPSRYEAGITGAGSVCTSTPGVTTSAAVPARSRSSGRVPAAGRPPPAAPAPRRRLGGDGRHDERQHGRAVAHLVELAVDHQQQVTRQRRPSSGSGGCGPSRAPRPWPAARPARGAGGSAWRWRSGPRRGGRRRSPGRRRPGRDRRGPPGLGRRDVGRHRRAGGTGQAFDHELGAPRRSPVSMRHSRPVFVCTVTRAPSAVDGDPVEVEAGGVVQRPGGQVEPGLEGADAVGGGVGPEQHRAPRFGRRRPCRRA